MPPQAVKPILTFTPLPWQAAAWQDLSPVQLLTGSAGGGKALTLDTPILTTEGWETMGSVSVGQLVFDERGMPCPVLKAAEVMYGHRVYAVRFDDGSEIKADAEHLWLTSTMASRASKRNNPLPPPVTFRSGGSPQQRAVDGVVTTEQIEATLRTIRCGNRINHAIQVAAPLQMPETVLPIPPYLLGVWLGDGTSSKGEISSADPEIIATIESLGYHVRYYCKYRYGVYLLMGQLRALGVLGNKHIPRAYLQASESQRRELLAGLMDTDGTALPSGQCEFYSCSRRLIDDTHELLIGLGIKCSICTGRAMLYGKDCGEKYRIKFAVTHPVFWLARKRLRQKQDKERGVQKSRYIVAVESIPSEPVRCIEVNSPSHLYLAGRSLIPTHNSSYAANRIHAYCQRYPGATVMALRKTRESMTNSVVLFLERSVIGPDPNVRHLRGAHRFEYTNGSILAYGGMANEDQREQIRSIGVTGGVDMVWLEEATGFIEDDYNEILARMRGQAATWRQIILSTNPDRPTHWIYKRLMQGKEATVFYSSAKDNFHNPASYFDALGKLTGVLALRLREGQWRQAEGVVYDEYDPVIHVIEKPWSEARYHAASVDWGYTNAGVILVWAIDGDGRAVCVREIYQSQRLVEGWWVDEAKKLDGEYHIDTWICDPSEPAYIQTFRNAGLNAVPAINDILPGVQAVKQRLKVQEDGRPRIAFLTTRQTHAPDALLVERKVPTSVTEEFPAYVWPKNKIGDKAEVPVDEHNHGCDSVRYLCKYLDDYTPASGISTDYNRDAGRVRDVSR